MTALVVAGCQSARAPAPPPPDQARLLAARDRDDLAAIRAHGWALWQRILPVWEHWSRSDAVFGATDRIFRELQPFKVGDRLEVETAPLMFAVIFDPVAAAHVEAHHLARGDTLRGHAAIPDFPRGAITLKSVWFPVHRDRETPLPVWDGEPAVADGNPTRTWRRRIVIDPSGAHDEPTSGAFDELIDGVHHVPLDAFIHRALTTPDEVAAARRVARDPTLAAGDHVVLVGMHVSTKEIPDWVWATLWWHDRPDDGPYAAGRPVTLAGASRNYLMDITLGAAAPRGPARAVMNPFLEARFPDGVRSNCLTCHRRAAHGTLDYLPVVREDTPVDDPYFADKTQTDMVWSLALEAR